MIFTFCQKFAKSTLNKKFKIKLIILHFHNMHLNNVKINKHIYFDNLKKQKESDLIDNIK